VWNIVITKDGRILIIEANNCISVNVLRAHKLLLTDERMKEIYKYYKII